MMTMMDYGSQFTGSTISSDTMSGSVGSVQPRIRTIRLVRPYNGILPPPGISARHGPNLGFSVRGGREHGTGFFVSVVEQGSAAHRQGLKVGDQIIRINGFTIEDAVHKEVLQLISNHAHLILKVRSVGMIPVKDRSTDPLNWQIISDNTSSTRSSPQLGEKIHDVRLNIMIAPRSKLGCGICKGPDSKPGIFVQYTKEGGIARETGLRPGDQILSCNNVDFTDIQFNEAVCIMKSSRQLDFLIRKSAGAELFPSESSGYNSSASSVTGDQSPSWSDSKRLSIVKEESLDLEDRLSKLDRLKWDNIEWNDSSCQYKPTIINLSGNDSIISNNGCQTVENNSDSANKLADICLISRQQETKTVVVEVHRSNAESAPKRKISPSICSSSSSSLTSAIAEEFQRRTQRNCPASAIEKPSIDEQIQKQKILKGVDTDKQQQHSRLMDEFKKVHRKMFKASDVVDEEDISSNVAEKEICTDRNGNRKVPPKPIERRSTLPLSESLQEKPLTRSISSAPAIKIPPPPPPLPPLLSNTQLLPSPLDNGTIYQTPSALQPVQTPKTKIPPPVPTKYSTLSYLKDIKDKIPQPPPCPPPDYDTISISSSNNVEMDSLDSFRLNNPANVYPKPPNNYFSRPKSMLAAQLSNGSTTSTGSRKQRPVSVVIGEYPSGSLRKQPQKLDFLNGGSGTECDRYSETNQFAAELTNTLNRSNLRRRTESMENILNDPQIKSQSNGSVTISLNRNFAKSINSLNELVAENKSNRVTINISSDKREDAVPNGILKNGTGNHKSLAQQKSITFGEMPTVINDLLKVS